MDDVLILMLVLRIPEKHTDLLITVNAAATPVEGGSAAPDMELCSPRARVELILQHPLVAEQQHDGAVELTWPERVFRDVVSSLHVVDWGLFG